MRKFSSIMNPRQLDYFEDISYTEEISSNSERHRPNDKKQFEESYVWCEISSTKNSRKEANSRRTARTRKYPRKQKIHRKEKLIYE